MTDLASHSTDTKCSRLRSATSRVLFFPSLKTTWVTSFVSFDATAAPIWRSTLSTARLRLSHSVRTSTNATTPEWQNTDKSYVKYVKMWLIRHSREAKEHSCHLNIDSDFTHFADHKVIKYFKHYILSKKYMPPYQVRAITAKKSTMW